MSLKDEAPVAAPLYAGFWRRGAALMLDALILIVPSMAVNIAMAGRLFAAFLLNMAIGCSYYALFHSSARQATPGKMAFGIKVTTLDGQRIGLGRGVGRYFATWISTIVFLVGYMMAGFTARKQALHDMIAGTLVVNRRADPEEIVAGGGTMPVGGAAIAVVAIFFLVPFVGGILAAIAIPAYSDYTLRAKLTEGVATARALGVSVEEAYNRREPYPTGPAKLPAGTVHVQDAEITSRGEVIVRMRPGIANGGRIVYTSSVDSDGRMRWRCSSPDIPDKLLPRDCRRSP